MSTPEISPNYTVRILKQFWERGDRDAIAMGEQRISGSKAFIRTLRFAATLRSSGLAPADGIVFLVESSPDALLLKLAVHFAGYTPVHVPPKPTISELEGLIRATGVLMLLFNAAFEVQVRKVIDRANVRHVFSIGPSPLAVNFLAIASGSTGLSLREAADGQYVSTLECTRGTTGLPKLIVRNSGYYDASTWARM